MILGIRIANFDVFTDEKIGLLLEESIKVANGEIDKKDSIRLHNMNALIGRNNTGKTSFIMAMEFLQRTVTRNVAVASTSEGRPGFCNLLIDKDKPSTFEVFFRTKGAAIEKDGKRIRRSEFLQYVLTIKANEFGSPVILNEKVLKSVRNNDQVEVKTLLDLTNGQGTILNPDGTSVDEASISDYHMTALGIYGKIALYKEISSLYREIEKWFFCSFASGKMSSYFSDGNAPGGHKHLNSTGSNVNNVLTYMAKSNPTEYDRVISDIVSKIPQMRIKKNLPEHLEESPDKLFLYLLLLKDLDPATTIFIETPDKDLYHDMVDVLANEMRSFTLKHAYSQIIFSTHSPYIVESMSPYEMWIFERESLQADISDGFSKDGFEDISYHDVSIRCAGEDDVVVQMFKEGVGMGAIWYGGHLDKNGGYKKGE